jgi:hypothetical protein
LTQLLTAQDNRFIDRSTNAATITRNGDTRVVAFSPFTPTTAYSAATHGGSAYFDGSGDWVNPSTTSANLALGSGDFTIEFWLNTSRGATRQYIFDFRNNGSTASITPATAPIIIWGDDGADGNGNWLRYAGISNGTVIANADLLGVTLSTLSNQWNHIVIVRSSGTVYGYLNGVRKNSVADATNYNVNCSVSIAAAFNGGANYLGNISDFRVVKGTAVYIGTTYTVPTAPLTAVANTSLLLNFVDAGIVDATGDNNIETVGDAKISTAQSKWGSSIYLDGTGDYLLTAPIQIAASNENFTIEYWFYATGNGTGWGYHLSTAATTGTNANSFFLGWEPSSGRLGGNWANASNRFPSGDGTFAGTTCVLNTWYHVALVRISGVMKIYLNGTASATTWSVSDALGLGSGFGDRLAIGYNLPTNAYTAQGYIQDVRITRAARYTGNFTPPTAQFAYNQGDINYNQWVPTNFSVTAGVGNDSLLDVPTNWGVDTGLGGEVRGNYATLNPINNSGGTFTNGNLDWTTPATDQRMALSSMTVSGISKWYCEFTMGSKTGSYWSVGIFGNSTVWNPRLHYRSDGARWVDSTQQAGNWSSFTQNDIIGIAFDGPTGTATFYKNSVSQGTMTVTDLTVLQYFGCTSDGSGGTMNYTANFGQRPFAYTAPSGFKSLNTHNLPALAVTKSNTAFDTLIWSGDSVNNRKLTTNFSPDLFWVKARNSAAYHSVNDSVRGANAILQTNTTSTEQVNSNGYVTTFASDGVNVTNGSDINASGTNYVGWAWDAGTTTVVNTAGSISANVRVNASAGISIATFATLAGGSGTFGHGLGVAPKFIIQKSRTGAQDWYVYHASLGASAYMLLNSSAAPVSSTAVWGGTTPSSAIVTLGSGWTNNNHGNVVAYCFAEVPGFSAFGTYTGNGSADGPFVYTGFRPAWIMIRRSDGIENWNLYDNKRNSYNVADLELYPNLSNSEGTYADRDFLSNGFKIRNTNIGRNASGGTYIYAAFAESPFKYARAR